MSQIRQRVVLELAYDGSGFHGWQRQACDLPTVQGVLEAALADVYNRSVTVHAAGRTDAGVHALGQVVHADVDGRVPLERLPAALNSQLPHAVVIRQAAKAPVDFHARFHANGKVYVYRIYEHPVPSPFLRRYALHQRRRLDGEAMAAAAKELVGRRDFASFEASGRPTQSSVRDLRRLEVQVLQGGWGREVRVVAAADGFLYKMVRNLVGTLLEVGRGRMTPADVRVVVAARDRTAAPETAPAAGLWLQAVHYDAPIWGETEPGSVNLDVGQPFT